MTKETNIMFGFSMHQLDCQLEISIAHRNREQIINLFFLV